MMSEFETNDEIICTLNSELRTLHTIADLNRSIEKQRLKAAVGACIYWTLARSGRVAA